MEPDFIFRDSAFKHKLSEADIRHAFSTCRYLGQCSDRQNVYLLLGFDTKANPIEVIFNEFGENGVNIFHTMPCQSRYLPLLNKEENK